MDDLWNMPTWEYIKYALVDSNHGSRIIITTRIHEVARRLGGIYNIKPLSKENSRKLFNNRIFGAEGVIPSNQPGEVPAQILEKCGGVPLSIVTIASVLVHKPRDEWYKVYDSIGFGQEQNDVVENTRKILAFSYDDLPSYLKTCLLYLSMYPEDSLIEKTDLIWRWVAEGIVSSKQGIGLLELGESFFNDLINRNMIQLIECSRIFSVGCRVHDMVLDLIRPLSKEINFVSVQDNRDQHGTCSSSRKNNVRRLSMHKTSMEHIHGMEMGQLRSFNAFMCPGGRIPPLRSFKVLRVLVLCRCDFPSGGCHLEHLGKLVQLRFLGLIRTNVSHLPKEIGLLKLLQALVVFQCGIKELPTSVSELSKLAFLLVSEGTRMMSEVGQLIYLQELSLGSVYLLPNFIQELGNLTELRVLRLQFEEMNEGVHKALVESLSKMQKIRTIDIHVKPKSPCLDIWEFWAPPSTLHDLQLGVIFPMLPSWINPSCVSRLSMIALRLFVLGARDMQILGSLPLLRFLSLIIWEDNSRSYTVASHEFQNLGYLLTNIEIICREGALSMLFSLTCVARVRKDIGLAGNMPLLQEVTYWLDCEDCIVEEVEEAEEALRQAAEANPNHPILTIERFNEAEVSETKTEELSRAVAAYLKDVLHSITDEEEPMVAYLRHVLPSSEEWADDETLLEVSTTLRDLLDGPEEVWSTDKLLRSLAAHLKDKLPVPGEVSATVQVPSDKVEAAEDCSGSPAAVEMDTDLDRLTLNNKEGGEIDSSATSAEGPGQSHP